MTISYFLSSCVSQSKYNEMVASKDSLEILSDSLRNTIESKNEEIYDFEETIAENRKLISQYQSEIFNLKDQIKSIKDKMTGDTRTMLNQLEDLQAKVIRLENTLSKKNQQIEEINKVLRARDEKMAALKDRISEALLGFKDKGLNVEIKDAKVYVSLSNQLLFNSGSTKIDNKGQDALLDLAQVLNENIDINILIEGHTDDQSVRTGRNFKDNWDLSVLRATEVARFLEKDGKLDPKRIIASGRSKFYPIQEGSDNESRALNRRTEIILTPDLKMIFDVIE